MKRWYSFKSKDRKVKGLVPARSELEVARFAGYPISELVIQRVKWNNEEFATIKNLGG